MPILYTIFVICQIKVYFLVFCDYNIHSAITHYKDKYGYIPPFVLMKILTFGVTSRYYGLLKQKDRQEIAKYFKISDKLLKQILKNLTSIRNIAAHSDRLFCF